MEGDMKLESTVWMKTKDRVRMVEVARCGGVSKRFQRQS